MTPEIHSTLTVVDWTDMTDEIRDSIPFGTPVYAPPRRLFYEIQYVCEEEIIELNVYGWRGRLIVSLEGPPVDKGESKYKGTYDSLEEIKEAISSGHLL